MTSRSDEMDELMELNRNRMDEDWDERRDGGCDVPEMELSEFEKRLEDGGSTHTSYYHYTNWDAFSKMMTEVKGGPARGLRMLLLTRASQTNDKIERGWGDNVYLACFSYSRYEDVAMWVNYGKKYKHDAIRIRFNGDKVREWFERHRQGDGFFRAIGGGGGFHYEEIGRSEIKSVKLVDVAYVLPSWMMNGRFRGNVEYSRDFYHVTENGSKGWSDEVYGGKCPERLSPYFKKRGWCHEREVRLVVTLRKAGDLPDRLAVEFCGPFDELQQNIEHGGQELQRSLLSGPWFSERESSRKHVCGLNLRDIRKSDYAKEVDIFTLCDECPFKKDAGAEPQQPASGREIVKLLAFCDVHESGYDGIDPTGHDIVLIAGDLQGYGCCSGTKPSPERIASQVKFINEKFLPWCNKYPDVHFVVVAGNNDEFALDPVNPLLALPSGSHIHYLQDSLVEIKGLRIWGSPWVKIKNHRKGAPKPFERSPDDFKKAFAQMPDDIDILVTHATPEVPGSYIAGSPENHFGCEALREIIEAKYPKVCVCGHIHAEDHHPVCLGQTIVMNVSRIHDKDRDHAAYRPRSFSMVKDSAGVWCCQYSEFDDLKIVKKGESR